MNTQPLVITLVALYGWLALVVVFKLLTGGVNGHGLLSTSVGHDTDLERIQALVISIGGAAAYAFVGLQAIGEGVKEIPGIPEELLAAYGGSQLLYLIGKRFRHG
jgi:hypothetical protein